MMVALAFRHNVGSRVARVIARVTGAPVHVAVIFGEEAIEATEPVGVRSVSAADLLKTGQWSVVELPEVSGLHAYQFARAHLGKRYDWVGVLFAWWAGRIGGNGARSRWFCSEFAVAVLSAGGLSLPVQRWAWYTPRRLFDCFVTRAVPR